MQTTTILYDTRAMTDQGADRESNPSVRSETCATDLMGKNDETRNKNMALDDPHTLTDRQTDIQCAEGTDYKRKKSGSESSVNCEQRLTCRRDTRIAQEETIDRCGDRSSLETTNDNYISTKGCESSPLPLSLLVHRLRWDTQFRRPNR